VVNYDVPGSPDDYVHRVGRTARASATGDAILFVSPEEESDVRSIERAIGQRLPRLTLGGFDYTARPVVPAMPARRPTPSFRAPRPGRGRAFGGGARGGGQGPWRPRMSSR
jgi:ATP-dependent RNA helicase RhlE